METLEEEITRRVLDKMLAMLALEDVEHDRRLIEGDPAGVRPHGVLDASSCRPL